MSWLRRLFTRCPHETIRCVHGDEIIFAANFRRACCTRCGKYLDRDLPEPCSVTNKPHPSKETP